MVIGRLLTKYSPADGSIVIRSRFIVAEWGHIVAIANHPIYPVIDNYTVKLPSLDLLETVNWTMSPVIKCYKLLYLTFRKIPKRWKVQDWGSSIW